jgi:acylphosphatase
MKRAVIIAKGEVQRVGYRDAVEKIARKLKITGFVHNLKPYDVRIVAEGEDDNIDRFIEEIKIKKLPINVESTEVSFEKFKGKFKFFEIKRGNWKEELGERLDTAGTLLYRSVELGEKSVELSEKSVELSEKSVELSEKSVELSEKSVGLSEKSVVLSEESVGIGKTMLEKQDQTISIIKSGVDEMHEFRSESRENFTTLREDYGKISDKMDMMNETLKKLTDALLNLAVKK